MNLLKVPVKLIVRALEERAVIHWISLTNLTLVGKMRWVANYYRSRGLCFERARERG
jgi:hypothetical protein